MDQPSKPSLDQAIEMIEACRTLTALFSVSAYLAEVFSGNDMVLEMLSDISTNQLAYLDDPNITTEALRAGKLTPPGLKPKVAIA